MKQITVHSLRVVNIQQIDTRVSIACEKDGKYLVAETKGSIGGYRDLLGTLVDISGIPRKERDRQWLEIKKLAPSAKPSQEPAASQTHTEIPEPAESHAEPERPDDAGAPGTIPAEKQRQLALAIAECLELKLGADTGKVLDALCLVAKGQALFYADGSRTALGISEGLAGCTLRVSTECRHEILAAFGIIEAQTPEAAVLARTMEVLKNLLTGDKPAQEN